MINLPYIVKNADELWFNIRWKETNGVPTCTCGCDTLYRLGDGRYKCKKCGKVFSDTTGTLLHHSKLSKEIWLTVMFEYAVTPECSAISISKKYNINYKTAYMMLQKLRYVCGKGDIKLDGCVRVDEAYIGAEWKNVHFNKKMDYMRSNGFISPDSRRYTKHQLLAAVSSKKSHILNLTDEHNVTLLLHVPNPVTKKTIQHIISQHTISKIVADESNLYRSLDIPVEQSNHSKRIFMTESGLTSNICETDFSWVKRKLNGVYTHTSDKYLQLYLNQRQFHFNNKNKTVDERFYCLMSYVISGSVKWSQIKDFDYSKDYPKSRRKQQEELYKNLVNNPLIESVEDKYGRRY